jgi:hypothetical protein
MKFGLHSMLTFSPSPQVLMLDVHTYKIVALPSQDM